MPLTTIPSVKSGGDSFFDAATGTQNILNSMMRNQLIPSEMNLKNAQTQEALGNAQKAQMIAHLFNIAYGSGNQPSPQGNDQSNMMPSFNGNQNTNQNPNPNNDYQLTQNDQNSINNLQPGQAYTIPPANPMGQNSPMSTQGMNRKDLVSRAKQDQSNFDQQYGAQHPNETQNMPQGNRQGNGHPDRQQAKEILQAMGFIKETPSEMAKREVGTNYQKVQAGADADVTKDWNKTISAGHEIQPALEMIQDVAANPTFQEMYKNPEYFGRDLDWMKRFGTPEQQDLLTKAGTATKSIFQNMGQDFKGSFREFEYKLFQQAAPTDHDTLQQLISKTNTLKALKGVVTQRLTLADNIRRSSNGEISPANALEIADKQINSREMVKKIENEFKENEKQQLALKETKEKSEKSNAPSNTPPSHAEVEIYDPQGKLIGWGSKEKAAKFLKDHKGYSQKVMNNG